MHCVDRMYDFWMLNLVNFNQKVLLVSESESSHFLYPLQSNLHTPVKD